MSRYYAGMKELSKECSVHYFGQSLFAVHIVYLGKVLRADVTF